MRTIKFTDIDYRLQCIVYWGNPILVEIEAWFFIECCSSHFGIREITWEITVNGAGWMSIGLADEFDFVDQVHLR